MNKPIFGMRPLIVLSLFDGISCGQEALRRILPKNRKYIYHSCEIHEGSMRITQRHYPNTIQLGDVRYVTLDMIPYKIDIIIGGAPCTNFSFAGRRKGMVTTENMFITSLNQYLNLKNEGFEFVGQSYLYWEYVRLVDLFKPEYFLLENVHMNKLWENVISKGLGVTPIRINSSLLSAQNRKRLYWTNIPGVTIPEDRKIMLSDIITDAVGGGGRRNRFNGNYHPDGRKKQDLGKYTTRKDGKSNCLTCGSGSCDKVTFTNGDIRPLSIDEWEILQTLPVGYTDVPGLSITSRKCSIGNAWTVDVISHIFSFIPNL